MKNTLILLLAMAGVSCSGRLYELADGRMVTGRRYERITSRNDRQLSDPVYMARLQKRLERKSERYDRRFWKKVTKEDPDFFNSIRSIEVVYDTGRVE